MKIKTLIIALMSLFVLTACNQAPVEDMQKKVTEDTEVVADNNPVGNWTREELFVAGDLQPSDNAALNLNEDMTYSSSTSACTGKGTYKAEDNQLTLIMEETSCPNIEVPFSVTYEYIIKRNKEVEIMTLTTDNLLANYKR